MTPEARRVQSQPTPQVEMVDIDWGDAESGFAVGLSPPPLMRRSRSMDMPEPQ